MTINPGDLSADFDRLEAIERASQRLVAQAIFDFAPQAKESFARETDLAQDIAEDITRDALDRLGTSVLPVRLFGKIDYKRARYVFHPDFAVRQALFVDSKAEKGATSITIQTAQTSMRIRQQRQGDEVDIPGALPKVYQSGEHSLLTTTIFVKYDYRVVFAAVGATDAVNELVKIVITCLPNGMLQELYNPDASEKFWLVGRNAPTLDEPFRVRVSLPRLKSLANWRVQSITVSPDIAYQWQP